MLWVTVFDKNELVESTIAKGRSLDDVVKEAREEIDQTWSRRPQSGYS